MDMSWFQQLSVPIQTLLLGAGGEYAGGLAAALTARLVGACGTKVKRMFAEEPRSRAVRMAMAKALHETAKGLSAKEDEVKLHLGRFGEWMKRDRVAEELAQLIEPGPEPKIDMELLRREYEAQGFGPGELGGNVSFEACVARFAEAFSDAAALEPELQEPIKIRALREISAGIRLQAGALQELAERERKKDRDKAAGLAGLQRNYLERIAEQCRFLPLRGIDLKSSDAACGPEERIGLAEVFIQLDTTEKRRKKKKARGGEEFAAGDPAAEPLPVIEALAASRQCVLLGQPGSGKSTFVNYLCMCLSSHRLEPEAGWIEKLPGWPREWSRLVPVPVVLREMAAWIKEADPPQTKAGLLLAYIEHWLSERVLKDYFGELLQSLRKGEALLLLDGLDEVAADPETRQRILDAAADLPAAFGSAPILVTCRVLSYQDPRWRLPEGKWRQYELSAFSPDKIEAFIHAWYRQLEAKGPVSEALKRSERLVQAVQRKDLARLAPNPLLLTVIALVNTHKGELPDTRAMLYEDVVDLLLWRWDAIRLQSDSGGASNWRGLLDAAGLGDIDLKGTLWEIAFGAHAQSPKGGDAAEATADIAESTLLDFLRNLHPRKSRDWADEVVQAIKQRAGLLVEGRPGVYRFPHRTFQEYLAGCHLCTMDFVGEAAALAREGNYWWEAILLAVGRLVHLNNEIDKPLMLISELCPQAIPYDPDEAFWRSAWLAGRCLVELGLARASRRLQGQDVVNRVRERLSALASEGRLSPRERAEAAVALGEIGDPRPGVGARDGLPQIDWVAVAAGPFPMGSRKDKDPDATDREMPQFACTLIEEPYRIGRYPVTVAQYEAFVAAGGYHESRYWTEAGWQWRRERQIQGPEGYGPPFETPNHPRVGVSWYEAAAFCNWLSEKLDSTVELPSEAQWERAARHTDGRIYPWGNELDPGRCNMGDTGIGSTSAAGIFPSGAAESGAMDMSGNVLEWCRTEYRKNYEDYEAKVRDDLEGESARVLRGGAFGFNRHGVRCAFRYWSGPDYRIVSLGFRVVSPGL
jgi:formylglycine-generating enzyme required for sulfatase activity